MIQRLRWQRGQTIRVFVVEICEDGSLIVNYEGNLVGVRNSTTTQFKLGQELALVVKSTQPLQFQIMRPHSQNFERFA